MLLAGGLPDLSAVAPMAVEDEPISFEGCLRGLVIDGRQYELSENGMYNSGTEPLYLISYTPVSNPSIISNCRTYQHLIAHISSSRLSDVLQSAYGKFYWKVCACVRVFVCACANNIVHCKVYLIFLNWYDTIFSVFYDSLSDLIMS